MGGPLPGERSAMTTTRLTVGWMLSVVVVAVGAWPLSAGSAGAQSLAAGGLGRRPPHGRSDRPAPGPRRGRGRLRGPGGARGDRPGLRGGGLDLQRHDPGTDDPGEGRRPADRPLHEQPAAAEHDPLARAPDPDRHGRRAGLLAGTGPAGRDVHLRLRRARRRHLLVSPARDVGGAGRVRPLRRLPGRGPGGRGDGRDRRRSRDRPQRHRRERRRHADPGRQRRRLRHALRPRGQPGAGQRPAPTAARRAGGGPATLAAGERGQAATSSWTSARGTSSGRSAATAA